jgi:hypothetical protein
MTTDSFSKIDWTYIETLAWVMSRSITVVNDVSEGLNNRSGKIGHIDLVIYHAFESLSGKRIHSADLTEAAAEIVNAGRAGKISVIGTKRGQGDLEPIPELEFLNKRFIEDEHGKTILCRGDNFYKEVLYWGDLAFRPQEVLKEWPPLPGTAKEDLPMPLRNKRPETWHWIQAMSWIAFNNPDPVIDGITVNAPREHSQYVGDTRVIIQHAIRELVDAVCDGEIKPSDSPMDHGRIVRANPSLMTDRDRENMVETLVPYFIWGKTVCESSSGYTASSSVRYFVDLRFRRQDILDIWPDDSGAALLERAYQVTDEPTTNTETINRKPTVSEINRFIESEFIPEGKKLAKNPTRDDLHKALKDKYNLSRDKAREYWNRLAPPEWKKIGPKPKT